MGYFPNMTAWEMWASNNCFKCAHWPKTDDEPACPVEMAHTLYSYELCNAKDDPGKVILDMLIPPTADGVGCDKCAMFRDRDGLTTKHLRDWQKYKALMAERDSATAKPELLSIVERFVALPSGAWHPERHAAEEAELMTEAKAAIARAKGTNHDRD